MLPLELIDALLSHVSDVESLKNCAVVARSWTFPCRIHLLRFGVTLDLRQPKIEFLERFISKHPRISRYVLSVEIVTRSSLERPPSTWNNVLIGFIRNLHHVHHVSLKSLCSPFPDNPLETAIKAMLSLHTIESISLTDIGSLSFLPTLQTLLSLPPNLKTLSLFIVRDLPYSDPSENCATPVPITIATYVRYEAITSVWNLLLGDSQGISKTLRCLRISNAFSISKWAIDAVSESLEEFVIFTKTTYSGNVPIYYFDLNSLRNLRILEFPFAYIDVAQRGLTTSNRQWDEHPLTKLRITNVKSNNEAWDSIHALNLSLADAIVSFGLGSLSLVEFSLDHSHSSESAQKKILEHTTELRKLGVTINIKGPPMPPYWAH